MVFAATAQFCAQVGWEYERVGELDPVHAANLRWLAGYRHPRYAQPALMERLRVVFASRHSPLDGAAAVGDPVAVLPVLFGMLWRGELAADLDSPAGTGDDGARSRRCGGRAPGGGQGCEAWWRTGRRPAGAGPG